MANWVGAIFWWKTGWVKNWLAPCVGEKLQGWVCDNRKETWVGEEMKGQGGETIDGDLRGLKNEDLVCCKSAWGTGWGEDFMMG